MPSRKPNQWEFFFRFVHRHWIFTMILRGKAWKLEKRRKLAKLFMDVPMDQIKVNHFKRIFFDAFSWYLKLPSHLPELDFYFWLVELFTYETSSDAEIASFYLRMPLHVLNRLPYACCWWHYLREHYTHRDSDEMAFQRTLDLTIKSLKDFDDFVFFILFYPIELQEDNELLQRIHVVRQWISAPRCNPQGVHLFRKLIWRIVERRWELQLLNFPPDSD